MLVTGAKGGLGSFVSEAFLEAGAVVVGVSRSIQASDFAHPRFTALPAELSSAEAAVIALVRTVALENKDRAISANVVLPGTMDTPGNRAADPKADTSKWVQPSQVAALLVHLAGDTGAQVTGAAIPVYGGQV